MSPGEVLSRHGESPCWPVEDVHCFPALHLPSTVSTCTASLLLCRAHLPPSLFAALSTSSSPSLSLQQGHT